MAGCLNGESNNNIENKDTTIVISQKDTNKYIIIAGKDIWVRDTPKNGKVILKLNSGDTCILLQKGKEQNIRGEIDFWYQIKYKKDTGWVFGSQTSIKSGKQESELDKQKKLINTFNSISKAIESGQLMSINKHFYQKNNVIIISNPGAYTVASFNGNLNSIKYFCDYYETCKLKFEKLPEYASSNEFEGWSKSGCFAQEVSGADFISIFEATNKYLLIEFSDSEYEKARQFGKLSSMKIIVTKLCLRFYFTYKNGKWLLMAVDTFDFSA